MLFDQFCQTCRETWNQYFKYVINNYDKVATNGKPLYPFIILCTNYQLHFSMELLGLNEKPTDKLKLIKRTGKDTYRYFDLFQGNQHKPLFLIGGNRSFTHLCLAHEFELKDVLDRFPFIETYGTSMIRVGGQGSVIEFGDSFNSVYFENCSIVNNKLDLYRCKNIIFTAFFRKNMKNQELKDILHEILEISPTNKKLHGVMTVGKEQEITAVASQLQNLYLSSDLRETTIGDLLAATPEILKKAFGVSDFLYEPYLEWEDGPEDTPNAPINPDFILKRADGSCLILDLKLAKIDKKKLTKDKRNRRRFVDYVTEGISQLSHYKEYFDYHKNVNYAIEKYGLKITDPSLILVVGSMENMLTNEVKEAMRSYKNLSIIDYDTLVATFIKSPR